jgi:hypothetical protein
MLAHLIDFGRQKVFAACLVRFLHDRFATQVAAATCR